MTDAKAPDYAQQFDLFNKLYQAMGSAVAAMPVNQRYKDLISQNLDQGFMWAREAFSILIQQQQSPSGIETVAGNDAGIPVESDESAAVPDAANDH